MHTCIQTSVPSGVGNALDAASGEYRGIMALCRWVWARLYSCPWSVLACLKSSALTQPQSKEHAKLCEHMHWGQVQGHHGTMGFVAGSLVSCIELDEHAKPRWECFIVVCLPMPVKPKGTSCTCIATGSLVLSPKSSLVYVDPPRALTPCDSDGFSLGLVTDLR